jgi:hypothetical protein
VYGETGYGIGVWGHALANTAVGSGYGVYGSTAVPFGGGSNWNLGFPYAVFANGNVGASGTKPFRIDHPADPLNKYLFHYSSEGPEPLNVYSGNATTDAKGSAWVQLPDYFAEINKDPRYQLTVIDDTAGPGFVQVKVAKKIKDNRFMIMTSAPGIEVSWRVECVRNDLWMQKYGAPVEIDKQGREKGKYQRPELYGMPASMGVDYDPNRPVVGANNVSRH